ncbi:MAG TPA: hypothetical protein VF260_11225 [Bacilli bacterium]
MGGEQKIRLDIRVIARQLGISETNLTEWMRAHKGESAPKDTALRGEAGDL